MASRADVDPPRLNGTPRELLPIAEQVLAWVAKQRRANEVTDGRWFRVGITEDDLRRIELCALATREAAMFFDLYGG